MAEEQNPQQVIDKPKGAQPAAKDSGPAIFTMPKEFRHGAQVQMVVPEKPKLAQKPPPVVRAPVPPRPPVQPVKDKKPVPGAKPGAKMPVKPVKKSMISAKLIIALILIVIILGIGAFFLLRSLPEPVDPTPPVIVTPDPEPVPDPDLEPEPPDPEPDLDPEPEPPFPQPTSSGVDTDSDGLTDIEEKTLYSTDHLKPDTDSDGFLDGNEVFHRYNPSGDAPGTLLGAGLVVMFESFALDQSDLPYSIVYPSVWKAEMVPDDERSVVFVSTTGEKVTLLLVPKLEMESISDWFAKQDNQLEVVKSQTKNKYEMLMSENQLKAYVDGGEFVMVFDYDAGIKGTIDYLQTFKMMINSVEVKNNQ